MLDYVINNWAGLLISITFAILPSLAIIYAGHEIRFRRLRMIVDYENAFVDQNPDKQVNEPSATTSGMADNPTFEFVKSKYVSDIRESEVPWPDGDEKRDLDAKFRAILQKPPGFLKIGSNIRLLFAASLFGILVFFGFAVATAQLSFFNTHTPPVALHDLLVFVGGLCKGTQNTEQFSQQILTVTSLAFLGGYISALREFLRRMAIFDLSSYTFLKLSVEILASMIAVFFLYRAFPDPFAQIASATGNGCNIPTHIPVGWYALAPLLGLFPESATRYLFLRTQIGLQWIKAEDNRFNEVTQITPLNVIDGIDFWTRIRLEQCGIIDVQGLATYNPIMLYIETPYGIYQVFDWVAQAQLCHIVGQEKFLLFREINIRTIFDLERAVRSYQSTDQFDEIAAAILLAPTASFAKVTKISEAEYLINDGTETKSVDYKAFSAWARTKIAESKSTSAAIEHMISWISDDLHVRRMRRLWIEISNSLGEKAIMLPDDKSMLDRSLKEKGVSDDTTQ